MAVAAAAAIFVNSALVSTYRNECWLFMDPLRVAVRR
jgi:hypothetical protein